MHYILSHCLINTYNGYIRQTINISKMKRNISTQNKISILVSHESNDNVTMFATRKPGQLWLLDIQTDVSISLRVLRNFAQTKNLSFYRNPNSSFAVFQFDEQNNIVVVFISLNAYVSVRRLSISTQLQCYQANYSSAW